MKQPIGYALGVLMALLPLKLAAEGRSIVGPTSSEAFAFARYLTSVDEGGAFPDSQPMAVEIDASLPGVYKQTRLLAIRKIGESERSEYLVLKTEGDVLVAQEVVAR